ncbi:MAG: hypothetical protein U1E46_14545 [Hyphomicrobiales bacterium]
MAAAIFAGAAGEASAHNCTCRAGGQNYPQGQVLCLRGKLARCEMFLNNSSWKIIADSCPVSSAPLHQLAQRATMDAHALAAPRCFAGTSSDDGP